MVRIRIPGGVLPTAQARGVARLAARHGSDWVHLTTRQNLELHWVADRSVRETLAELERVGLSTRSACGHTLRRHVLRGRRRRARRAVRLPQRRPRRERCDPRPIRRAQLRAAEPYQRRLRRIPSVSGGRLDGASRFSGV